MASDLPRDDEDLDRLVFELRRIAEDMIRRDDPLLANPSIRKLVENLQATAQDWFDARGRDKGEGGGYPADIG